MAVTKQKKAEVLDKLQSVFKTAPTSVFVNFHGLGVSETQEMRSALRQSDVSYTVAKKTLIKKALQDAKASGEAPALDGEIAVAYLKEGNTDTTSPARGVFEFQKKFEDRVSILGGIFDGKFLNREEMLEIATIPSIDVLRGMFVNVINSPIQGLAVALSAIADKRE